jgi:hypothetical protein
MKNESHTTRLHMTTTREFTIQYRNGKNFTAKNADLNLFTFKCAATSEKDAIRQLELSRAYSIEETKGGKMRRSFKVRRFTVVRVFHGDGIHRCTCDYCKKHPDMAPRITVIPAKQPGWMKRNYFRSK